jgi:phage-related protein
LYRDSTKASAHRDGKYCAPVSRCSSGRGIPACYRDCSLPTNGTVGRIAALVTQTTTTAVPLQASLISRDRNICFLIKKHISLQKHLPVTVKFKVQFLEDAKDFLDNLADKPREKIIYNIRKAQMTQDKELFKKLNGEIWEFRTLYNKMHYRLFAFWDKTEKIDTIVISTHGLIKKTDKTPISDIDKAERLRNLYFQQKKQKK